MTMLYRPFGRTGESVSILGFGCMRLPILDGRHENIDVPLATEMLRYAIDEGVNYIDTAYPYHGVATDGSPGASEPFVGQALQGGYRDKVMIATKLPPWLVKSRKEMDEVLDGQLQRLRTDCIDCYLLHALNAGQFKRMADLGALEFLDAAKRQGRIRFAGFSFHDEGAAFAPIVDAYEWDFCQIQYNYMDQEHQAGVAGLAHAHDKGLAVVVMEPLKGGRLAAKPPAAIQSLWEAAPVRRTAVGWALRFVWDDPRVSVLLSGMGAMEQVVENVALASEGQPASLTEAEIATVGEVRQAYRARTLVDCTACHYCMPCPQGINIPLLFGLMNDAALYGDTAAERSVHDMLVQAGQTAPASACSKCEQCIEACPQQLEVTRELEGVEEMFEKA